MKKKRTKQQLVTKRKKDGNKRCILFDIHLHVYCQVHTLNNNNVTLLMFSVSNIIELQRLVLATILKKPKIRYRLTLLPLVENLFTEIHGTHIPPITSSVSTVLPSLHCACSSTTVLGLGTKPNGSLHRVHG